MGPEAGLNIPESPINDDPTVALSTGYAQSKYIGTSFPFPLPLLAFRGTPLLPSPLFWFLFFQNGC